MADTMQIERSDQSCSDGLEYARKQSEGFAKDAILRGWPCVILP